MRPLSGLDASFLYLESNRTPMHIGGVYLIDSDGSAEDFDYTRFHAHIRARLKRSMIFRERLAEVPLHLAHPYWINDPEFVLDFHLPRVSLPSPGGYAELMSLASRLFAMPLNRDRPLWQMTFVEGVDGIPGMGRGSVAVIARVHHAMIDGVSGAELMGALLDVEPHPKPDDSSDQWRAERMPSAAEMVGRAYLRLGSKAWHLGRFASEVVVGLGRAYGIRKVAQINPPTLPLTAPRSLFNRAVTSRRCFWGQNLDFSRIHALRTSLRAADLNMNQLTINDVVLSICSGGLRRYLQQRQALPSEPLVAMVPMSVRTNAQKSSMGNQVSAMLVNLETTSDNPLDRMQRIHQHARSSKVYSAALPAGEIAEFIPSETAALAARLYTRTRLGERHKPFFNLVITNVPGPQVPLYLAGGRVVEHIGTAPLMDGLGLMLVIFSYAGSLNIGITSCPEIVPAPEHLASCFEEALIELETHASAHMAQLQLSQPPATDTTNPKASAEQGRQSVNRLSESTRLLRQVLAELDEQLTDQDH